MARKVLSLALVLGFVAINGCSSSGSDPVDTLTGQDTVNDTALVDVVTYDINEDTARTDVVVTSDTTVTTDTSVESDTTTTDDTVQGEDTTTGTDTTVGPVPFTCSTGAVVEGWNNKRTIAGKSRDFFARLPTNPTKPVGVIFVYHGFGDSVDNFKNFFNPNPSGDADFPFVLIYPKSLALQPYGGEAGIEWSIFTSEADDSNLDAMVFEEILGCLGTTVTIDTGSVFVVGFSAGAIFTNLLHARYPDLLPTVLSMSGAWFNDADTKDGVNTMGLATLNWADLTTQTGTVFMTHGGAEDTYGMMGIEVINFENSAQFAKPFLTGNGRTIIDCPHTSGHTNHPQLSIASMVKFFKEHRGGGVSPWAAGGIPGGYPDGCTILQAQ
jgi:predicted esterase